MDFPQTLRGLEPSDLAPLMRAALSPARALHTLGVESVAAAMALRWDIDPRNARQAALLHDITKDAPSQLKLREECDIMSLIWETTAPQAHHALTAAALAARWGLPGDVVGAIRWHTTGRPGMEALEKILYLADMAEPSRKDYSGLESLRRLIFEDLDAALRLGLSQSLSFVAKKRQPADPNTRLALEWLQD